MAARKIKKAKKSRGWGGKRAGAGRKPGSGANLRESHRSWPKHDGRNPVHVTLLRVKGMPSLRSGRLVRIVRDAVDATKDAGIEGFRVVRYEIEPSQIELVIEADDELTLGRGMRSISIRVARRVNAALGRQGHVWADRYRTRPPR